MKGHGDVGVAIIIEIDGDDVGWCPGEIQIRGGVESARTVTRQDHDSLTVRKRDDGVDLAIAVGICGEQIVRLVSQRYGKRSLEREIPFSGKHPQGVAIVIENQQVWKTIARHI